jgi:hypothetical protein
MGLVLYDMGSTSGHGQHQWAWTAPDPAPSAGNTTEDMSWDLHVTEVQLIGHCLEVLQCAQVLQCMRQCCVWKQHQKQDMHTDTSTSTSGYTQLLMLLLQRCQVLQLQLQVGQRHSQLLRPGTPALRASSRQRLLLHNLLLTSQLLQQGIAGDV